MAAYEDQHAKWAEEMPEKSLANLAEVERELAGLRTAIEQREPLSLGRINFLSKALEGLREVAGAW